MTWFPYTVKPEILQINWKYIDKFTVDTKENSYLGLACINLSPIELSFKLIFTLNEPIIKY